MSRQFDPSQVGPEEARKQSRSYLPRGRSPQEQRRRKIEGHQESLFPVEGHDFRLEPHQQTRQQFADDPRTWWHGRYSEAMPKTGGQRNAGIHVGTFGSSDKRRRDLGPSRKFKDGKAQEWRSFPVRLRGAVGNEPKSHGYDEGARWSARRGIHYYENQIEDAGSISAMVPSRENLLTHSQAVKEAKQKGLYVHPHILWEQKQMGRREYDPTKRDPHADPKSTLSRLGLDWSNQPQKMNLPSTHNEPDAKQHRRNLAFAAGISTSHQDYATYVVHGVH